MSQSLTLKRRTQPYLDYKELVHRGPTDINIRHFIDIEKKTSPGVTKQTLQWTAPPKMTYERRHSEVTLHSGAGYSCNWKAGGSFPGCTSLHAKVSLSRIHLNSFIGV